MSQLTLSQYKIVSGPWSKGKKGSKVTIPDDSLLTCPVHFFMSHFSYLVLLNWILALFFSLFG